MVPFGDLQVPLSFGDLQCSIMLGFTSSTEGQMPEDEYSGHVQLSVGQSPVTFEGLVSVLVKPASIANAIQDQACGRI